MELKALVEQRKKDLAKNWVEVHGASSLFTSAISFATSLISLRNQKSESRQMLKWLDVDIILYSS